MNIFFNMIGITGMVCFLVAYFLIQAEKLAGNSYGFLGLNLAGAILVIISLMWDWNLPAFLLESAFALISIYGIGRRLLYQPQATRHKPRRQKRP